MILILTADDREKRNVAQELAERYPEILIVVETDPAQTVEAHAYGREAWMAANDMQSRIIAKVGRLLL